MLKSILLLIIGLLPLVSNAQNLAKKLQAVDDYIIEENYDYAEQLLGKILRKDEGVHQAHYKLATVYRLQEQYKKALEEAVKAVQQKPEEPNYNALLGTIWFTLDEKEKGHESIKKALLIDSLLPEALLYRGDFYVENEEFALALKDFKSLKKVVSSEPQILYRIAFCQMELGKIYSAVRSFKKVIEINPLDIEARIKLAECHYQLEEYADAIFQVNQLQNLQPSSTNLVLRAKCYIKQEKLLQAKKDLLEAKGMVKLDFDIEVNLIAVEELLLDYEKALTLTNQLMARYPGMAPLQVLKGRLLAKMGLYKDAHRAFGLAINGLEKQKLPFVSQVQAYINLCGYLSQSGNAFYPNGCDSFSFYTYYYGNLQQKGWTYNCDDDTKYKTYSSGKSKTENVGMKLAVYFFNSENANNIAEEIDLLETIRSAGNYEKLEYHIADILLNSKEYKVR